MAPSRHGRGNLGRTVLGQLDVVCDRHGDDRRIALRIEPLIGDRADLDARKPHVGTDVQAIDARKPGIELIARHAAADMGGGIGKAEENGSDGNHHRPDQGFDDVSGHGADIRLNASAALLGRPGLVIAGRLLAPRPAAQPAGRDDTHSRCR